MIIKSMTIENFKGIRDPVTIEFKPITLLFGPNSAGKSTIIQALHYAKEILERENVDADTTISSGEFLDLGGFKNMVHGHNTIHEIELTFELDLSKSDLPVEWDNSHLSSDHGIAYWEASSLLEQQANSAWVKIWIAWSNNLNMPIVKMIDIGFGDDLFAQIVASDDLKNIYLTGINMKHPVFVADEDTKKGVEDPEHHLLSLFSATIKDDYYDEEQGFAVNIGLLNQKSALPGTGLLKFQDEIWKEDIAPEDDLGHWWPKEAFKGTVSAAIIGPINLVREELKSLCYISHDREIPPRNFQPAKSPDPSRWANGLAAWDILCEEDSAIVKKVNKWLNDRDKLDSGYSIHIDKFYEITEWDPILKVGDIDDPNQGRDDLYFKSIDYPQGVKPYLIKNNINYLSPQDIGVGLAKIIPVFVASIHRKTGFVIIEEPESNVHPGYQVVLGDLFISQIKEKPDVTFLVETHSEHLLLRLLRRIREQADSELPPDVKGLTPDELGVNYIEISDKGSTCLHELKLSKDGNFIDKWPKGFFEERIDEFP